MQSNFCWVIQLFSLACTVKGYYDREYLQGEGGEGGSEQGQSPPFWAPSRPQSVSAPSRRGAGGAANLSGKHWKSQLWVCSAKQAVFVIES